MKGTQIFNNEVTHFNQSQFQYKESSNPSEGKLIMLIFFSSTMLTLTHQQLDRPLQNERNIHLLQQREGFCDINEQTTITVKRTKKTQRQ